MPTPAQRRRQQEVGGKIGAVGWERPQSTPRLAEPCFTAPAKKVITALLRKKAATRLGCLAGGFDDVKREEFFKGFDWAALQEGRMRPPFVPTVHLAVSGLGW